MQASSHIPHTYVPLTQVDDYGGPLAQEIFTTYTRMCPKVNPLALELIDQGPYQAQPEVLDVNAAHCEWGDQIKKTLAHMKTEDLRLLHKLLKPLFSSFKKFDNQMRLGVIGSFKKIPAEEWESFARQLSLLVPGSILDHFDCHLVTLLLLDLDFNRRKVFTSTACRLMEPEWDKNQRMHFMLILSHLSEETLKSFHASFFTLEEEEQADLMKTLTEPTPFEAHLLDKAFPKNEKLSKELQQAALKGLRPKDVEIIENTLAHFPQFV